MKMIRSILQRKMKAGNMAPKSLRLKTLILIFLLLGVSCNTERNRDAESAKPEKTQDIVFDESKWKTKIDGEYAYRDRMLEDLVSNEEFRKYNQNELLELLGEPDFYREDSSYLHYRITENKIGFFTLKTKTLVIKISEDSTITWMKIHGS